MGTAEAPSPIASLAGRVDAIASGTGQTMYTVFGPSVGAFLGSDVVVVGDTSGNSVPDYFVHAIGIGYGDALLLEGADGSVIAQYAAAFPGEFGGDELLFAPVGDINSDGLADYAIARVLWNALTGKVTIYAGGSPGSILREHLGTQPGWGYGNGAIMPLGDVDGDAASDYVISSFAWGSVTVLTAPGEAWLYSGASGALLTTFVSPPGTAWLGTWGDVTDDLDGDGSQDLLLCAPAGPLPGPAPGVPGAGQVLAYSSLTGNLLQVIDIPAIAIPPTGYPSSFGSGLRSVGDIDQDGRSDFVCTRSAGNLYIYTRDIVSVAPNPVPIGSTATFALSVPAQPNTPFRLVFSLTAATGIPIGTRVFPLDLDPVILTSLSSPYLAGVLDATGAMNLPVTVPPDPSLSGASLKYSAFTISPTAPYYIKTFSPAKTITVQ